MKTKFKEFLLEKSSLTKLGVPKEAMQYIQKEFEIHENAQWERIYKDEIFDMELDPKKKNLFIQVTFQRIRIIVNNYGEYYIQDYSYEESNFGNYLIEERQYMTKTQILKRISSKKLLFQLTEGKFKVSERKKRLVKKNVKKFEKTTNELKDYILKNFNKILRRIYQKHHKELIDKVVWNIENMAPHVNAADLSHFLKYNRKFVEIANEYEAAIKNDDILRIEQLEKQYNSLAKIDEYLLDFESIYSEKFNNRLTIADLVKDFGMMKIATAFMYYLYTGKTKELNIQVQK